jgi:hypothetical protein
MHIGTKIIEVLKFGNDTNNSKFNAYTNNSKIISENARYHSAQNLLSSPLLSKNIKIKIFRTIIFPVVLYGSEKWSVTLKEENRLMRLRIGC